MTIHRDPIKVVKVVSKPSRVWPKRIIEGLGVDNKGNKGVIRHVTLPRLPYIRFVAPHVN